jgi:uncharacterized membrane protein YjgN (DUF898 family)
MKSDQISALQCRDAAMALTFLLLLLYFFIGSLIFLYLAMAFLLLAMLIPDAIRPAAKGWFALSRLLGMASSKVILTIIYAALVCPMALIRRFIFRKDALGLKQWRDKRPSAFVIREHLFRREDLQNPF